jgi:superfamily II DNA or RNA helicase
VIGPSSDLCEPAAVEVLDFDPDDCVASVEVAMRQVSRTGWVYRDYQEHCFLCIDQAFLEYRRILIVLATGLGKTVIFVHVARKVVEAGGKVLILAHSEELLDQAADKLLRSTGLVAAKEKAKHHATTYDSVVLASVATLARPDRLKGWNPAHFQLVIVDEAHRSRAKSYETILNHFTGKTLGVTATADRGDKQSLASIYEHLAFEFNLLSAVLQGWLVRPHVETIPLKIDLTGVKTSRTPEGSDFNLTEVSHRIEPFLSEIARQLASRVTERGQGIIFLPSVMTARMMADCLVAAGINADFVSGECEDRTEKIAAFKAGKLRVICNAMLLIEGFDHDAVDWICVLRPTKIRSLYVQAVGRGTRPLNEIVDRINRATSAEERKQIIAASAKPALWLYDFLWLTEKLDLITRVDLVARNAAVAAHMKANPKDGDLLDLESDAEHDLLESLKKAAAKHRTKKGRVIDPLAFAIAVNDETMAAYEPSSRWEFKPPTPEQLAILEKNGLNTAKIATAGLASKVIDKIDQRKKLGLCSVRQMCFLEKMGFKDAALMSSKQAGFLMSQQKNRWGRHRKTAAP